MESYEICSSTLIIKPKDKNQAYVYELNDEFVVDRRAVKIVDDSCKFFGSDLVGRQNGTKSLIGVRIKVPIIVEETKSLIFFPTASPRYDDCVWVSFNNLVKYQKISKEQTKLIFINNKEIVVDVSYNIIDNQITRCIRLERTLLSRKKAI